MNKISAVAEQEHAKQVTEVTVRFGALSHISADHFREHFEHGTQGTIAENARLIIIEAKETGSEQAQDVLLESVEIAE